jgi:hypothetical protein
MTRATLRHTLEVTTNLAVLAVCITIAVTLVRGRQSQLQGSNSTSTESRKGQVFPAIENVSYDKAESTLVLALNTQCKFCRESLPFYRKLLSTHSPTTQIAIIFPNPDKEVLEFVDEAKLPAPAVGGQDFSKFQIDGTPTLVLVGRNGKVQDLWAGELTAAREKQVLSAIQKGGA